MEAQVARHMPSPEGRPHNLLVVEQGNRVGIALGEVAYSVKAKRCYPTNFSENR